MTEMTDKQIRKDRLRFTKNSFSATLTYLSILFDVLYFICIYKSDVGNYYYNYLIGVSIVYNLLFMLAAFLCSEGVKNYKEGYGWVLIALGIGQIVRIFILPLSAYEATITLAGVETDVMGDAQFLRLVIYLLCSAAAAFIGGIAAVTKTRMLRAYEASLKQ